MSKIEIINVVEHEDGSVTVELEVDEASKNLLLELGFNALLMESLKKNEGTF